jgi:hypothetical protein
MDGVQNSGVQNSLHSKAVGLAGVMGIIAVLTVVSSWFFVARGLDAKDAHILANVVLIGAALLGTAGCALYIYAIARGFHFWAALGLVGVVIAPTGFAYGGNILALVAAGLLVFVGAREHWRDSKRAHAASDVLDVPESATSNQ